MKIFFSFLLFVLITQITFAQVDSASISKVKIEPTTVDSASYGMGIVFAKNFPKEMFPDIDLAVLIKGFMDARNNSTIIDEEKAQAVAFTYVNKANQENQERIAREQAAQNAVTFAGNKKEQSDFIVLTRAKEGVTTTTTGLMYEVITEGSGVKPITSQDKVKVHYKGTYINGEEFDSSYRRNAPSTFGLNQVISGWTEGIQLMSVGSKYKFYIPSNLAYGDAGGRMEPFKLLIFEVELLAVNP